MGNKRNIIDILDEAGMLYLAIAELISADVLVDSESCLEAKTNLEKLKSDFLTSKKNDNGKIAELLQNAELIINKELRKYNI